MTAHDVSEQRSKILERLAERWFALAPGIAAAGAFLAGALTLVAVATPALPHVSGLDAIDRLVSETPELSASIGGVLLMGLASGLARRVDAAWAATTALLGAITVYALVRHSHLPAGVAAGGGAILLAFSRGAFFHRSPLGSLAPDRRGALAIAGAFGVAAVGALLWAGGRAGFAEAPWWALLTDPHFGRPGRALASGAAAFAVLLAYRFLLSRARGAPTPASDADKKRAEAIIAAAPETAPDAELAFTGDKSFIFLDNVFIMAARSGASLVAMGDPIGDLAARRPALAAFRAEAERLSLRPVVYAATPELLPELLDLNFRIEKVGENALIELAGFSLEGPSRQKQRSARRRFVEREGAIFEVLTPPHHPQIFESLRTVSDAWLASHGAREKAFSLGAFEPAYLARHTLALVRKGERILGFANLWVNCARTRGAIDLMRFDPAQAPNGLMDFLITEILLWARADGMRAFDLGMAPLAGLASDQFASLFARIGRLVHAYGEPFYGFQGLRAFKAKFAPRWESRYIAAPGAWTLPIVLAEVAILSNGGRSERD